MINPEISKIAVSFSDYWKLIYKEQPRYLLDFTYPSVGLLDLFLQQLYDKKKYSARDLTHILGASCYLAQITYQCWINFSGEPKVNVQYDTEEVIISIQGGAFQSENEVSKINVTRTLINILQNPKSPFPFFSQEVTILPQEPKRISYFAIGLFTGLSPYIEGKLSKIEEKDFLENIKLSVDLLSQSCSEFYIRIFPSEPLGASPELYKNFLILPPLGDIKFDIPRVNIEQLNSYLDSLNKTSDEKLALLNNLCIFPNELIAITAFSLLIAIEKNSQNPYRRLQVETFTIDIRSIMDCIYYAHVITRENPVYIDIIQKLDSLGLCPFLLYKIKDYFQDGKDEIIPLLNNNSQYNEKYFKDNLTDPFISLQYLYTLIQFDELDKATNVLSIIRNYEFSNFIDCYNFLKCFLDYKLNKPLIEILGNMESLCIPFNSNISVSLAALELKVFILMKLKKYQEAYFEIMKYFDKSESSLSLRIYYNFLDLCYKLGEIEQFRNELGKLKKYLSYHHKYFIYFSRQFINI